MMKKENEKNLKKMTTEEIFKSLKELKGNDSIDEEKLMKLAKSMNEFQDSPFMMSHRYKGVKNSKEIEIDLDKQLVSTMHQTLRGHQVGGNTYHRGKMMLFEILASMNEFKDRIK